MIRTRIDPISRDIELIFREELSPEARRRTIAQYAREQIGQARDVNRRALGKEPRRLTFVDGRPDAPLESVRPDGVIEVEFELRAEVLGWTGGQLFEHSPFKRGRYRGDKGDGGHLLLADGVEVGRATRDGFAGELPERVARFTYIPVVPYARRIERGWSKQAPNGVYQAVAALARRRFGNIAQITFGYGALAGSYESSPERATHPGRTEMRQPLIHMAF